MFNTESAPEWSPEIYEGTTSSPPGELAVTALNPDNRREVQQLIGLFTEHYGRSHPVRGVYEVDFWSRASDEVDRDQAQLISFLVHLQGHLVAHLGCRLSSDQTQVELVLPAVLPSARKNLFTICRRLWECIAQQAERQSWHSMHHYNLTSQPIWQVLAKKCFHASECALIPPCESTTSQILHLRDPSHRGGLLVMHNAFTHDEEVRDVFVPVEHQQMAELLLRNMNVTRHFCRSGSATLERRSWGKLGGPKSSAYHLVKRNSLGLVELFLRPSLGELHEFMSSVEDLSKQCERDQYRLAVLVHLGDPGCPDLCRRAAEHGFRFAGMLPSTDREDYLVLCRYTAEQLSEFNVYSPTAQTLRNYMRDLLTD